MPETGDAWLGRVVAGRYQVTGTIGQGGMGTVYEAEQLGLERYVALKVLHPHVAKTPGAVARFQREAQLMARLKHPGAVHLFDHGADGDILYLAMERVFGLPLDEVLETYGQLEVKAAVELTARVLDVLEAAHDLGMVHRDLKPSNVMLVGELSAPTVKVLDFGLAALVHEEPQARLTGSGQMLGTPAYMSPEHCRGEPPDGRADLYSVGCLLHELLVGQPPFGDSPAVEVMSGHLYRPPPPVRQLRPERGIPEALEKLVLACLSKEKALRPASARELASRLRESLAPPPLRGEGKKQERTQPPPVPPPAPSPELLARPVGVIEPEDSTHSHGITTALAVAGYRVVPCREDASLEGLHALVVVPRSDQAQEEALALASTLTTRPHAPPVLLCGSGEDFSLMSRAVAGGVYDYVPLPLDPTDLARKVGRALRSRR
ncbi:serine/threonine-protein kinase [Archangium gephyra]|uniref:Serine/threonine-protein kinase n=1 Tax=Archangium gephyra TaxID=48 RepID=A0AAC8TKD6_9BACT|nr:serine/threonine-protein kinase [Archangium gephyra]AKJ07981.1 Serine/threonine-protein kinase pkn3 [Archangium gephyra]REG29725.1 serine/threonine-protein kinase [Archangium gephyra]